MPRNKRTPAFDPERIRDISVEVYKARLEDNKAGAVKRMLEKDGDDGKALRGRAGAYDVLTRVYLRVLEK